LTIEILTSGDKPRGAGFAARLAKRQGQGEEG
jgi:hypothetical protein